MSTKAMVRSGFPATLLDDFFKPFNEWFDDSRNVNRFSAVPAVNIVENGNHYGISLAAPGLKKEDFQIEIEGNMITISSEKEERTEDKQEKFTRKEYNYTSFSRSFNLPEDVKKENIEATYENGVLRINLPRKEEAQKAELSKKITVK